MLQNLFATFKVTQEHWNHYPTDLILRYMQLLWHTHMHAHTFTHTLTGFYSFLKWHFKLASVSNALFCRASEKNRLDCSFEQPWGIWDCCCCYWCGISADFCPRLACLSASETLYILSCWPPAGRGINNKNTSHGRTDVDTASLHLAISTDSSCPRTLLLCHSNASKETSTNTPSHTHTHTHIRVPIPKSYPLQYQLQYPQQPRLLVTFFSFFMIDVSARRMQRSTNKQHKRLHWAKSITISYSTIISNHHILKEFNPLANLGVKQSFLWV